MKMSRSNPAKPAQPALAPEATETAPVRPKTRRASRAQPLAAVTAPAPASEPSREELIRQAAYALYEQRGCGEGQDFQDWVHAEALVDRQLGLTTPG